MNIHIFSAWCMLVTTWLIPKYVYLTGEKDRFLLTLFLLNSAGVDGLLCVTDGSICDEAGTLKWFPVTSSPARVTSLASGCFELDTSLDSLDDFVSCDQNCFVINNFCRAFSRRFLTESNLRRVRGLFPSAFSSFFRSSCVPSSFMTVISGNVFTITSGSSDFPISSSLTTTSFVTTATAATRISSSSGPASISSQSSSDFVSGFIDVRVLGMSKISRFSSMSWTWKGF